MPLNGLSEGCSYSSAPVDSYYPLWKLVTFRSRMSNLLRSHLSGCHATLLERCVTSRKTAAKDTIECLQYYRTNNRGKVVRKNLLFQMNTPMALTQKPPTPQGYFHANSFIIQFLLDLIIHNADNCSCQCI